MGKQKRAHPPLHKGVCVIMQLGSAHRIATRTKQMMIRLPVRFMFGPKGKRVFTLDTSRIKEFIKISDDCVVWLAKVLCPPIYVSKPKPPGQKHDYGALAAEYQQLLSSGVCHDRADIARHRGVSPAWATKAIKRGGTNNKRGTTNAMSGSFCRHIAEMHVCTDHSRECTPFRQI